MGIAIYLRDGLTADELLQAADIVMYQAKRAGTDMAFAQALS